MSLVSETAMYGPPPTRLLFHKLRGCPGLLMLAHAYSGILRLAQAGSSRLTVKIDVVNEI